MANWILAATFSIFLSLLTFESDFARAQSEITPPHDVGDEARTPLKEGHSFGISVENDSRNVGGPGVDQAYSNGIKFSYTYARDKIPSWVPKFFLETSYFKRELEKSGANFGLALNHQIYTPNNTSIVTLIPNDRPYAAWLNLAFSLNIKTENYSHMFEASVGAVGPVAIGEQVQNGFHRLIGTSTSAGWGNQLDNEPVLQLMYQRRLRFFELRSGGARYFDIIPIVGGGLGNVLIGAHAGAIARLGWNLPDNFGPSRPSGAEADSFVVAGVPKRPKHGYFVFAGARGNAVARNLFLDGNTFRSSHRVTKYPFTAETEIGVGVHVLPVSLVWRFVVRSPDFEENSGFNSFASLGLTYTTD